MKKTKHKNRGILILLLFSIIFSQEIIKSNEQVSEKIKEEIVNNKLDNNLEVVIIFSDTLANEATPSVNDIFIKGYNIGFAPSFGILSGETFSGIPIGGTAVITTPYEFNFGSLSYKISLIFGNYLGDHKGVSFDPVIIGLGGNFFLFNYLSFEGHLGKIGDGYGFRVFGGISLQKILDRGLNLNIPSDILLGNELFLSDDLAGSGNTSGWIGLALKLDYEF